MSSHAWPSPHHFRQAITNKATELPILLSLSKPHFTTSYFFSSPLLFFHSQQHVMGAHFCTNPSSLPPSFPPLPHHPTQHHHHHLHTTFFLSGILSNPQYRRLLGKEASKQPGGDVPVLHVDHIDEGRKGQEVEDQIYSRCYWG